MAVADEISKIVKAVAALGKRRLAILAIAGMAAMATIGGAAYLLSRPQFEVLYAGVDAQDAPRMAAAMRESGINFDLGADGGTFYVEYGQGPRARMLLAERGLPRNAVAGYELFDKIGSLGLTSFMQDVTKTRALEGELSRSIQSMRGVRAARVHLALGDDGSFRKKPQAASASVVLKLISADEAGAARAVRHLVAAAVPGLTPETVTVLSTDGAVLASGPDGDGGGAARSIGLERTVAEMLQNNIRRTLAPMLGLRRFNVSVVPRLNTDARQTSETVYNPDSRVERSVRVTKENQTSQNASSQSATSVERNIPSDKAKGDGKSSTEDTQKKEELTNYEVSSKSVQTTSGGYAIERLSVAILVDRAGLASAGAAPDPGAIERKIAEIAELSASAVGLNKERGDVLKVAAVEFTEDAGALDPVQAPGFAQLAARHLGSIVNSLALVAVVALVSTFGLRPLARSIATLADTVPREIAPQPGGTPLIGSPPRPPADPQSQLATSGASEASGQQRLERLVSHDEAQVAAVLRQWVRARDEA